MARFDVHPVAFIEADAGLGLAGTELGGGVGVAVLAEDGLTPGRRHYRARVTVSTVVTTSTTNDRDAGWPGAPWPETIDGAGTYTWGYVMAGIDLKLEGHVFLFSELGLAVRLGLDRDATLMYEARPDSAVGPALRSGVGVTF